MDVCWVLYIRQALGSSMELISVKTDNYFMDPLIGKRFMDTEEFKSLFVLNLKELSSFL